MSVYFVALAATVVLLCFVFARRERVNIPYNRMQNSDKNSVAKLICDICLRTKTVNFGRGINPASLMPKIRKANRSIEDKLRKGQIIGEAEKWLYENFYLLYRYVYMRKDDMKSLPHINGVPRIVVVAKIIVNNSLGSLDGERVRYILNEINGRFYLSYAELNRLSNAIMYALTEQAYILADRLLKESQSRKLSRKFNPALLSSDTYVYFLFKYCALTEKQRQFLEKRGITEKKAAVNYNNTVLYNTETAKTVFTGLREAANYVPADINIKYLGAYNTISKDFKLDNVSVETLKSYFEVISDIASSTGADEDYVAEKACETAKYNNCDISEVLFDHKRSLKSSVKSGFAKKLRKKSTVLQQRLYCYEIALFSAIVSACIGIFFDIAVGIFSFIPILFVVQNSLNYALSFVFGNKIPPELNNKTVPHNSRVAVVVSEFVSSVEQFKESYSHLRLLRASNGGENIEFCLLLDTKGGSEAVSDLDKAIMDFARDTESEEDICIFLRRKTLIDGKYSGKERKRGAINAINKLFVTGDRSDFLFIGNENYFVPKYVVTLDADNMLVTGDVTEMVNIISHPYNKKYDLLTLHSRYDLYSLKTAYSLRFKEESGIEEYPVYSDLFYGLFGRDIYCGKGIYNLNAFYEKTEGVFPSGKILSHDILEGTVLTTGGATTVLEEAPTGFLSDRSRKKRWIRGDIQLLPFVGGRWKTDENERYANKNEPFYKFIMLMNVLGALKPVMLFAMLLYGLFSPLRTMALCFAIYSAPYAVDIIKSFRGMAYGMRIRYVLSAIAKKLFNFIEDFFMLGYYAVDNSVLFFTTLGRMAAKKNLLNWKTYRDSQADGKFSEYVKEFCLSFFLVTVIAVVSSFFNKKSIYLGIYNICAIVVYIELYLFSAKKLAKKAIPQAEREKLSEYAEKTYKYFSYMLSYNPLIGDNLQIKPYKGIASITSPTNIGFSLIAEICAYRLDIIGVDECLKSLSEIIDALEKLPKWKGNLYNWYDIDKKQPVNPFVSSVDSGNLLACLIVCREFFSENNDRAYELKTQLMITDTNIAALYDSNRNMFYIGFDGEKFVGHYDLLNSESRLLTTIYTAFSKNIKNYRCLQRDYCAFGGNTLLSWSGTAFETLMPALFMPSPKNSMMQRTERNVCAAQKSYRYYGLWGVGESGYYSFDDNLKYQYYAFGLRNMSLKNERTVPIISPYSSALCLENIPLEVIKNLENIDECGGMGEYGFYEAIDCKVGKNTVYSYMSHHQGMLLCAIANYLKDDCIKELFTKDENIAAVLKNFNEISSKGNNLHNLREKRQKHAINTNEYYKNITNLEEYFHVFALNDGDYSLFINAFGGGFSKNADIYLGQFFGVYEDNVGSFFYLKNSEGQLFSPTFLPIADKCNYAVSGTGNEVVFTNKTRGASEKVALLNGINGEVRQLICEENRCEIAFYSSVSLNGYDAFISHPVYNGLFVSARSDGNILILKNRKRNKGGKDLLIGVKVEGVKNLVFECNTENFIGRNGDLAAPIVFDGQKTAPSLGDVLNPCIGFCGKLASDRCSVAIIYGEKEEEILSILNSLPEDMYSYALLSDGKRRINRYTEDVLGEVMYVPYSQKMLENIVKNGLTDAFMRHNEQKKILLYKFSENCMEKFDEFLEMLNGFKLLGLKVKPYVELKRGEDSQVKNFVTKRIEEVRAEGCSIVFDDENIEQYAFISFNSDMSYKKTKFQFNKKFELQRNEEEYYRENSFSSGSMLFESGCGGFDEHDAYLVRKKTLLPYSNVIAAENGGMLITENGGGFFYFENSRENKMNRFDNDPIIDDFSEFLYAKTSDGYHRLNCGTGKNRFVVFDRGSAVFVSKINGLACTLRYSTLFEGRGRIITVDAINEGGYVEFIYGLMPALNWRYDPKYLYFSRRENIFTVFNPENGKSLYIAVISDRKRDLTYGEEARIPYFEYFVSDESAKFHLVFSEDESLIKSCNINNLSYYIEREESYYDSLGNIDVVSRDRSLNIITKWLPYQVMTSRINGKLGFYQVGGANGFRDRLQDALSIMHFMPEKTRGIIIDSAKHQYEEGDVMHWWHPPKFGLRTTITDDKLFLPLVVADYVEFSGDFGVLEIKLPYLSSPRLSFGEKTRYENPPYTATKETLLEHCLKAIKSSLRYGEHGLLIMGGGDWNDGMDEVCAEGKGESVFNSMLAYEVICKIAPFCADERKRDLLRIAEELKRAVNNFAYDKDRYMRLYSDDGFWLGSEGSDILKLDILTQSYAVISGIATEERTEKILDTAMTLVDRNAGIIKLLSPPLGEKSDLGYISAYPEGVRENGGQYTHAAIWYLIALTEAGRQDEAYELFSMINPVEKLRDADYGKMYKGEPYVLSGDVYSNSDNYGRMGWSWYTGSAGWAYKLVIEKFFGLKRRGKKLYINPHLPKKLLSSVLSYRYGESIYSIEYRSDEKFSVEINGEALAENYITLEEGTLKKIKVGIPLRLFEA